MRDFVRGALFSILADFVPGAKFLDLFAGTGSVGLEALSAKVPVAAWHSGGIHEFNPYPLAAWGDVVGLAKLAAKLYRTDPIVIQQASKKESTYRLLAVYRQVVQL